MFTQKKIVHFQSCLWITNNVMTTCQVDNQSYIYIGIVCWNTYKVLLTRYFGPNISSPLAVLRMWEMPFSFRNLWFTTALKPPCHKPPLPSLASSIQLGTCSLLWLNSMAYRNIIVKLLLRKNVHPYCGSEFSNRLDFCSQFPLRNK